MLSRQHKYDQKMSHFGQLIKYETDHEQEEEEQKRLRIQKKKFIKVDLISIPN